MRSFPVFFLYSLKAASRINSNLEEDVGVWESEDMALVIGYLLEYGRLVNMQERVEGNW